ncbi:DUF1801 domain-containing protein [Pedobacter alpinus]|uniref:DUF1801 domain-containing protein n=1 Tax=Pedobacter alpinus TaxID=1590643 RepID=A0ABW5TRG8_9SPHI
MNTNPKVDEFFDKLSQWKPELEKLRAIVLDCQLIEELKWGQPCYTSNNTNVIILANFKAHCAISFLKGVLLNDADQILISPGENSQSVRFVKFTSIKEILKLEPVLKAYLYEAIEIEKLGLKIEKKKPAELVLVKEFQEYLNANAKLKIAFEALTPGRQRAYNMFFESAKQVKTRHTRINKYITQILNGQGINGCTCGMSKKLPYCDGSHKFVV